MKLVFDRTNKIADNPLIYKSTDFKDITVALLGILAFIIRSQMKNYSFCRLGQ